MSEHNEHTVNLKECYFCLSNELGRKLALARKVVHKYGKHLSGCKVGDFSISMHKRICTCMLEAAIKAMDEGK